LWEYWMADQRGDLWVGMRAVQWELMLAESLVVRLAAMMAGLWELKTVGQ
jgi:hypothetical protein